LYFIITRLHFGHINAVVVSVVSSVMVFLPARVHGAPAAPGFCPVPVVEQRDQASWQLGQPSAARSSSIIAGFSSGVLHRGHFMARALHPDWRWVAASVTRAYMLASNARVENRFEVLPWRTMKG
jgi:hypothetical protein